MVVRPFIKDPVRQEAVVRFMTEGATGNTIALKPLFLGLHRERRIHYVMFLVLPFRARTKLNCQAPLFCLSYRLPPIL